MILRTLLDLLKVCKACSDLGYFRLGGNYTYSYYKNFCIKKQL